jgi:hypothetical protein
MSEWPLKTLRKSGAFQAEYEGSIPFTRSNVFNELACERFLLPTNRAEHFRQGLPRLFATLRAAVPGRGARIFVPVIVGPVDFAGGSAIHTSCGMESANV